MYKVRIAIFLIALFVIGIVLTISGVSNLIKMNGYVPDFNYDSMQDIKNGDIVQGYIGYIDGCYANTTTTETTYGIETNSYVSEEYFVMPLINEADLENNMYITIVAKNKADRELLYDICDATWEYYGGNENAVFPDMGIVAKVKKLDGDYEKFLVEWFQLDPPYFENEADARTHIVPYALEIYKPKSAYISLGVGLVIVILFVVVGIVIYNKYKTSSNPYSTPSSAPASNDFTIESKPSENGFRESYTPPQPVPIPDIPQPVQPDEFFERVPKAAEPVAEEVPKEEPAAPAVTESVPGDMDGLDTTGLFDDADYEVDEAFNESEFIE